MSSNKLSYYHRHAIDKYSMLIFTSERYFKINFDNFNYIKCIPYFKKGRNLLLYFSSKSKGFDKDTSTGVEE